MRWSEAEKEILVGLLLDPDDSNRSLLWQLADRVTAQGKHLREEFGARPGETLRDMVERIVCERDELLVRLAALQVAGEMLSQYADKTAGGELPQVAP